MKSSRTDVDASLLELREGGEIIVDHVSLICIGVDSIGDGVRVGRIFEPIVDDRIVGQNGLGIRGGLGRGTVQQRAGGDKRQDAALNGEGTVSFH